MARPDVVARGAHAALSDLLGVPFLLAAALTLIFLGSLFLIPVVTRAAAGPFWFFFKVALFIYAMIWFRGTFPRFRYDQLMRIGWRYMIPIGMGAILVDAVAGMLKGR
jgi:NADH-quinone oxidoreductase subunit H